MCLALACDRRDTQNFNSERDHDGTPPRHFATDSGSRPVSSEADDTRNRQATSDDAGVSLVSSEAAAASVTASATPSSEVPTGAPPNPYVPHGPEISVIGDGRLSEGGSFEKSQGFGWDLCPGASANGISLYGLSPNYGGDAGVKAAADGERYVHLIPPSPAGDPTRPPGVEAPFAFYLDRGDEVTAGVPQYIYFEIENLAATEPVGTLAFAGLEVTCETKEPWLSIPLSDLSLSSTWETRCVEFVATEDFQVFGIWMSGTEYSIGVDAFRFGPPCN